MPENHSGYHKYRQFNPYWNSKGTESFEKRNYYFYTQRRRPPGLVGRCSTVFVVFSFMYGGYKLKEMRREKERQKVVAYEFKRKSVPFFQAIEDRRYLVQEQRYKWLMEELFKDNKEEYLALSRFYNDPTVFRGQAARGHLYFGGVQKSYKAYEGQLRDFFIGKDKYVQNKPNEHF